MNFLPLLGITAFFQVVPGIGAQGCNVGEVYPFATVECDLRIHNDTAAATTIVLSAVEAGDHVDPTTVVLEPGAAASVAAKIKVGNVEGPLSRSFNVFSRGDSTPTSSVRVNGFVTGALDQANPSVSFGAVKAGATPTTTLSLSSHETSSFRIVKVTEVPEGVEVRVSKDAQNLNLRLRSDSPWGILQGYVKLQIDTPRQTEAWVAVNAEVEGKVAPASNRVWMGTILSGAVRHYSIPLKSADGRDFHVDSVAVKGINSAAHVIDCTPSAAGCKAIELDFAGERRTGIVRGTLEAKLPDFSREISIPIWGILQADSAAVRKNEFPDSVVGGAPNSPAAAASTPRDPPDSVSATSPKPAKNSAIQSGTAPPPAVGPLLKWTVVDDAGVHGYQVFRSDAESGPFLLVSRPMIPANSDSPRGTNAYKWRDASAQQGTAYWYYIGAVSTDGVKKKLSKPLRKVAMATD